MAPQQSSTKPTLKLCNRFLNAKCTNKQCPLSHDVVVSIKDRVYRPKKGTINRKLTGDKTGSSDNDSKAATEVLYTCPHASCGTLFASKWGLSCHLKSHLSMADRPRFKCDHCERSYLSKSDKSKHMRKGHAEKLTGSAVASGSSKIIKKVVVVGSKKQTVKTPKSRVPRKCQANSGEGNVDMDEEIESESLSLAKDFTEAEESSPLVSDPNFEDQDDSGMEEDSLVEDAPVVPPYATPVTPARKLRRVIRDSVEIKVAAASDDACVGAVMLEGVDISLMKHLVQTGTEEEEDTEVPVAKNGGGVADQVSQRGAIDYPCGGRDEDDLSSLCSSACAPMAAPVSCVPTTALDQLVESWFINGIPNSSFLPVPSVLYPAPLL